MRKLATIRKIDDLQPIEGADKIEVATVGGWKVVAQKGLYEVGDLAVYFEIDSWIPHNIAPFLSKGREPREYEGVKGEVLKTVKLRGQVSQGLLMPLSELFSATRNHEPFVGEDLTDLLGILKYEKPIPAQLAGEVLGHFPSFIPKTDQERVQNIDLSEIRGMTFEVTEKLDGSSMTVYVNEGHIGVCSRNLELRETEGNTLWRVARECGIIDLMTGIDQNFAIQGELVGPGIQGNKYKLKEHKFFVFDIWDIDFQKYLSPEARFKFCQKYDLPHVATLAYEPLGSASVDVLLSNAEGKSALNYQAEREGLVFKSADATVSFKAISNKFLLKNGD